MYIATIPNRTSPPAILLRESYRDGQKVKTRTLANITHWPAERIHALRRCLKGEFDGVGEATVPVSDRIFAVLFVLKEVAQTVGLVHALGKDRLAKLALFLVLARVAHQGSRLSTVRWAEDQAVAEVLGLAPFDEEDLYDALDWLAEHQEKLEKTLYRAYVQRVGQTPVLVLYDVSSSYFEGVQNELAEYGYNRDGKRGKKQIVLGLLTAADGEPLAVRVFPGNTTDSTTVATQIKIVKQRFGVTEVVFVGDRGMVKANGKTALTAEGLKSITALTDPQVRKLLQKQVIPLELFDEIAQEVEYGELRLVLRRNEAVRRNEAHRRQDQLAKLQRLLAERNALVAQSKRAKPAAGLGNRIHKAKPGALMTIPIGAINVNLGADLSGFPAIAAVYDQLNIMSYGMAGAWSGWKSWHSSALYHTDSATPMSIDSTVKLYLAASVPAAKLGIGIGFYGLCYSSPVTAPDQALNGSTLVASDGAISYARIMTSYYSASARQWDALARVPYLSFASPHAPDGCTYISYDDEQSIAEKGAYVKAKGLGGVIQWELNEGYLSSAAAGHRNPLLIQLRTWTP